MSDIAIRINNLSKKYKLGAYASGSLRVALTDGVKQLLGKKTPLGDFWALKNINLEIKKGEVIGIVGHNGAGKSTLLKVLSRITEPTEGSIELYGRITSLLEVGTGFHPELTGRENIFLNGSILGMSQEEIKRKFDEIVEFSGVSKFLDTPVKHYSSGMYVRLAFSVAAHLEAEILIFDEVLAVGDAAFQNKCLAKMNEIAKSGRTVLFVSHNMNAVKALCKTGVLMGNGEILEVGDIDKITYSYFMHSLKEGMMHTRYFQKPTKKGLVIWPERITVLLDNKPSALGKVGETIAFDIAYQAYAPVEDFHVQVVISSVTYGDILIASTNFLSYERNKQPSEEGILRVSFDGATLLSGKYTASFWIGPAEVQAQTFTNVLGFELEHYDVWGTGKTPSKLTPMYCNANIEFLANCDYEELLEDESISKERVKPTQL